METGKFKNVTRKVKNGGRFYFSESTGQYIRHFEDDLRDLVQGFLEQIESLGQALNADGRADPTYLLDTLIRQVNFELDKIWAAVNEEIGEITIDQVSHEKSGGYFGQILGAALKTNSKKMKNVFLTADHLREFDLLEDFIADTCSILDEGKIKTEELWGRYKKWHAENVGGGELSRLVFARFLRSKGYIKEGPGAQQCVGIELIE